MASTGEVGCIGEDLHEALLQALIATGFQFPQVGVLLSLGPLPDKYGFVEEARVITEELQLPVYATPGTAEMLVGLDIDCIAVKKTEGTGSAIGLIESKAVDLVINVPREFDEFGRPDGYMIRRCAVDHNVPLITDLQLARAVVEALRQKRPEDLKAISWNQYVNVSEADFA